MVGSHRGTHTQRDSRPHTMMPLPPGSVDGCVARGPPRDKGRAMPTHRSWSAAGVAFAVFETRRFLLHPHRCHLPDGKYVAAMGGGGDDDRRRLNDGLRGGGEVAPSSPPRDTKTTALEETDAAVAGARSSGEELSFPPPRRSGGDGK